MGKYDGIVGLAGATLGLIGIGYGIGMHSKMAKISEKLDCSIEELASKTPIDIPNNMIERAVEKAVADQAKESVGKATDVAVAAVKRDIHKQINDAVEEEYSNIKESVLEEVVAEAAKIDVKRVRADIEKAAKERAMEKFDDNLDDILAGHTRELENVTKIYRAIADLNAPAQNHTNNNREVTLRLG